MITIAYLRVSTESQDLDQQRLTILDYAQTHRVTIDEFVETQGSSQHAAQKADLIHLIDSLKPGDRVIVSELSRFGRSLSQILQVIDLLIQKELRLVAIKEAIRFEGKQDFQTKAMIALFGLFAEIERDLIAERTKEGLAAAKARGQRLGRPKGTRSPSKLDGKEDEIRTLLQKKGVKGIDLTHHGGIADDPASFYQDPEVAAEGGNESVITSSVKFSEALRWIA